jgi:glutamine synthetase
LFEAEPEIVVVVIDHGSSVGLVGSTVRIKNFTHDQPSISTKSDCLLQPAYVIPDPDRFGGNGWLIMCEVLNPDGTPHESNGRAMINDDDNDFWFGFEQEYTLIDLETNLPLKHLCV